MGSSRTARSWHSESATWSQLERMHSKMMQGDGAKIEVTTVVTVLSYLSCCIRRASFIMLYRFVRLYSNINIFYHVIYRFVFCQVIQ